MKGLDGQAQMGDDRPVFLPVLRGVATVFGVIVLSLVPRSGLAWDQLDIHSWVRDPSAKLLAVDFYASWCRPCKEAEPRWVDMQKRYASKGLRLVVVSVQSDGRCGSPQWKPDRIVCDREGAIAEKWGAKDLPQAFLWSWQGSMLVQNGTVDQVDKAVARYFAQEPRILVEAPVDLRNQELAGPEYAAIHQTVRAELRRTSRFELLANEREKTEIRRVRREGHEVNYEGSERCRLGVEVSPNSLLKATLAQTSKGDRLRLELFSLERGCLTAASYVRVVDGDFEAAAVEAVSKLVHSLSGRVLVPGEESDEEHMEVEEQEYSPEMAVYFHILKDSKLAQRRRQEKTRRMEKAWTIVLSAASNVALSERNRIDALQKFVEDFEDVNTHEAEANALLKRLKYGGTGGVTFASVGLASVYHDLPLGVYAEFFRIRWKTFQLSSLSGFFVKQDNDISVHHENISWWAGLLGIGVRTSLGGGEDNEMGFLVYPLSFGFHWIEGADDGRTCGDDKEDKGSYAAKSLSFMQLKAYYRRYLSRWHFEVGMQVPLLWLSHSCDVWRYERYDDDEGNCVVCDRSSSSSWPSDSEQGYDDLDDFEAYASGIPLMLYFGGGF